MSKPEIYVDGFIGADLLKRESKRPRRKDPERKTTSEKCESNTDHLLKEGEFFCRNCGSKNPDFATTLGLYAGVCKRLSGAEINLRKSLKLLDSSVNEKKKVKSRESVQYWTNKKDDLLKEKGALAEELVKMQSDERNIS